MPEDFLEKTLEDIIMEIKDTVHEYGFEVLLSNNVRQFRLPSGKKIDILSFEIMHSDLLFYIIELKKNKTDDALSQAYGYLHEALNLWKPLFENIYCKVILVGHEITYNPISYYLSMPTEMYTYTYKAKGIDFNMGFSNCDVPINDRKIK